jgi:hypothetical protein
VILECPGPRLDRRLTPGGKSSGCPTRHSSTLIVAALVLASSPAHAHYGDQQLDRLAAEMPCAKQPASERTRRGLAACPFDSDATRAALLKLQRAALANAKKHSGSEAFGSSMLLRQAYVLAGKVLSYDRDARTEECTVRLQVAPGEVARLVSRQSIPADPGDRIEAVGYLAGFQGAELVLATATSGDVGSTKQDVHDADHPSKKNIFGN